ncbi:tripartite motif-containing protein 3-like [Diadema antillarum]|uniref:tripartite motif-containing protein 3-like n=1 Tax=Diadema antillarum TaxID=105358 RepID=UPI003A88CC34
MATFQPISSQELECPICLTLFSQPKALTCSHTFCENCLARIFQTQPNQQTITCPVCRKGTPVPSGDVSELPTNKRLSSLVDEVKTKNPTCTNCGIDQESPTVSYCQDCGDYMCKSCDTNHFAFKPVSNHKVVPVGDVLSGKVPLRRRGKCKKHPNADSDCFCTNCREYFCLTCGTVDHMQKGHLLEKVAVHEENLMTNIEELQKKAKSKKTTIGNHIDNIQTQRNEITTILKNLNDDIDKTYEEYVNLLSARREALKCQVQRLSEKFEKELKVMEEESHQTISHMNKMEELVANGMKVPLEKDALIAHDTLCENLKSFLGRDDPDDQSPRGVTERAKKISFLRHIKVNELSLGELKSWDIKADVELPVKSSMGCMTRAPDGKMAVGSEKGGIHLYSPDGELQQTVLKDVKIRQIGSLSDGRSVVCDTKDKMSLYTPQWEKLDVTFETMSYNEGGIAGLTVDRDDNIYVSYWESKKIQVFTQQGGKAVREIMCDGYKALQLFSFLSTGKLIVSYLPAVVCIDGNGKKEHVLMEKEGMTALPAVCRDDSVIVAWVKHEEGLIDLNGGERLSLHSYRDN